MKLEDAKEGDVIIDSLNWEWVFIMHNKTMWLYPLDYYNFGKLSEKKGGCSFLHDPKNWNLTNLSVNRNIND